MLRIHQDYLIDENGKKKAVVCQEVYARQGQENDQGEGVPILYLQFSILTFEWSERVGHICDKRHRWSREVLRSGYRKDRTQ